MSVKITGGEGQMHFDATMTIDQFMKNANTLNSKIDSIADSVNKQGSSMESFAKKAAVAAAGYFSIQTASNFLSQIVKVRGEFQQLDVAFSTILKSKSKADALMSEVVQLAATTPFSLTDVATSAKQLLAYGFAADEVKDTLTSLGNVAAGVSAPIGDIAYLYGTLRTQGRAYAKDIQQFAGRGIPIIAELAKQFKVNEDRVLGLVEAGKVGFPEVEKAFKNMTTAGGIFFNLMEEQSRTLTGKISNLGDAFDTMLNKIGQSNEGILNAGLDGAIALVKNYQTVLDILEGLILVYGSYRAALIAEAALKQIITARTVGMTTAELLHYQAILVKTAAQRALNTVMLAMPTIALTATIAALALAIYALVTAETAAEKSQKALNDISADAAQKIGQEKDKIDTLVSVLKDKTKSHNDQEQALKRLIAISPEYLGGLTLQNATTAEGKKLIDDYLLALQDKAQGELAYAAKQKEIARIIELNTKGVSFGEATIERLLAGPFKRLSKEDIVKKLVKDSEDVIKEIDKKYGEKIKQSILDPTKDLKVTVTPLIDPEAIKKYESLLKKREELERDLQNGLAEARRDSLKDEEREFAEIEAIYTEKLHKIEELNKELETAAKKSGKKFEAISTQPIEDERDLKLGKLGQDLAIEAYQKEVEAKKQIFEEFEDFKAKFGSEAALKEYETQVGSFTSFLQFLDTELDKRKKDTSRVGTAQKAILQPLQQSEKKEERQKYTDLLAELINYEDERKRLIDKYNEQKSKLEEKGKTNEIITLTETHKANLAAHDDANIQKLGAYKKLFDGIEYLSNKAASIVIEDAEAMLAGLVEAGKISQELAKQILDKITGAKNSLADRLPKGLGILAGEIRELAGAVIGIDETFANILNTVSNVVYGIGQLKQGVADYKNAKQTGGDGLGQLAAGLGIAGAGIGIITSVVGSVTKFFKAAKESREQAQKAIDDFQSKISEGEFTINEKMRERMRLQVKINELRIDGLKKENSLLKEQSVSNKSEFNLVLAQLQQQKAVIGQSVVKYGGFFGLGRKSKVIEISQSLAGKTFEQLEKLFLSGQLDEKAKILFERLQKIKEEGADIDALLIENAQNAKELFTGATSDSILDSIINGFKEGKRSAADFADNFQELMQNAALNAFKFSILDKQIQAFYDEFSTAAQSEGMVTDAEMAQLQQRWNDIIASSAQKFDELGKITGVDFAKNQNSLNSLAGSLRANMTEETALVLTGHNTSSYKIVVGLKLKKNRYVCMDSISW